MGQRPQRPNTSPNSRGAESPPAEFLCPVALIGLARSLFLSCNAIPGTTQEGHAPSRQARSMAEHYKRAAKPNNTSSQTLSAFGTRCQPRRCSRSSRRTSVVSSCRSNPNHPISPSRYLLGRCQPVLSARGSPFRSKLLHGGAPLSHQSG